MPAWNDLLNELEAQPTGDAKAAWLRDRQVRSIADIGRLRNGNNVLLYGSAFLQKPQLPGQLLQLTHEDLNGFMSVIYGMDYNAGLTLVLHTPGGVTNAVESIVAYLWSKFPTLEVIVPAYAFSAGTMVSLSANLIIMGRQSQLGPIDPQMGLSGRFVSARAIVEQFDRAKVEILGNRTLAHAWAPVLQGLGPSLLVEAQNALEYGENMVARWLAARMFATEKPRKARAMARKAAAHFNDASQHKSHGRRIDRDEARAQGLRVEDLEASQALQEAVLTAYHVMTITFEKSNAAKLLCSHHNRVWIKNHAT